jgi:hypothetical protein
LPALLEILLAMKEGDSRQHSRVEKNDHGKTQSWEKSEGLEAAEAGSANIMAAA